MDTRAQLDTVFLLPTKRCLLDLLKSEAVFLKCTKERKGSREKLRRFAQQCWKCLKIQQWFATNNFFLPTEIHFFPKTDFLLSFSDFLLSMKMAESGKIILVSIIDFGDIHVQLRQFSLNMKLALSISAIYKFD